METDPPPAPQAPGLGAEKAPCACPNAGGYAPPPLLRFSAPRKTAEEEAMTGAERDEYVRGGASFVVEPPPAEEEETAAGGDGPPPAAGGPDEASSSSVVGGRETKSTAELLKKVSTNTCECSELVERGPGEPCSSAQVVAAITDFVRAGAGAGAGAAETAGAETADKEVVREAAQVLGCTSESCVVAHPRFRKFVAEGSGPGGVHALEAELRQRFKPAGPRNSTSLLSNFNLDDVLQQWAVTFPSFYNYGFNMIDFETVGSSLARVDVAGILQGRETQDLGPVGGLVRRPCDTFACVLNTDVSSGRGKHWVALFGDCRGRGPWSVEYFNSAGNPPPPPVTRWLEEATARLASFRAAHPREYGSGSVDAVPLTDVRHQNSQSECGLYALYFIRRRLEGAPYAEFQGQRIPDSAMVAFRKHIFRAEQ